MRTNLYIRIIFILTITIHFNMNKLLLICLLTVMCIFVLILHEYRSKYLISEVFSGRGGRVGTILCRTRSARA